MRIVPLNEMTFRVFASWFHPNLVPYPRAAIMVSENIEGAELLVGGVCIYETDGPYILFEHFALNPSIPITLKHKVAEAVVRAAKTYLATRAKVGFAWVNFEGGKQLFERLGFVPQNTLLMTHIPGTPEPPQPVVSLTPKPEPAPKPDPEPKTDELDEHFQELRRQLMEDDDDEDDLGFRKTTSKPAAPKKKAKRRQSKRRSLAN